MEVSETQLKNSVSQLLNDFKKANVKKELKSLREYLDNKKQEIDKVTEILLLADDYERFSNNIFLQYSGSYENVKNNIKTILKENFDINDDESQEFNYNSLIGYLVTFKKANKDYIKNSQIAEYIELSKTAQNTNIQNSIIGVAIECLAEAQKSFNNQLEQFLDNEGKDPEEITKAINLYLELSRDIENLLINKLSDTELRKSFLLTIQIKKDFLIDTPSKEYKAYLKASKAMQEFFRNLLKIGYYYKLNDENINIADYLVIDKDIWLLKSLNSLTQSNVIMESYDFMNGSKEIAETAFYFEKINNTPNCWMFKTECKDQLGNPICSSNYECFYEDSYLQDITKPKFEDISCDNPDKRFRIECLQCLKATDSIDNSSIGNLFEEECIKNA